MVFRLFRVIFRASEGVGCKDKLRLVQFRMVFSCDPISVIGMQRIISVGEIALLLSPLTREFSLRLFHGR